MSKLAKLIGGPLDGQTTPQAVATSVIAVPVGEDLRQLVQSKPYAMAVYQHRDDAYHFAGFQRPRDEPFLAEFADGPNRGTHAVRQPPHFARVRVHIPLIDENTVFDGDGEPTAIAVYESRETDGRWRFHLVEIDDSPETVASIRAQVAERRAALEAAASETEPPGDTTSAE